MIQCLCLREALELDNFSVCDERAREEGFLLDGKTKSHKDCLQQFVRGEWFGDYVGIAPGCPERSHHSEADEPEADRHSFSFFFVDNFLTF